MEIRRAWLASGFGLLAIEMKPRRVGSRILMPSNYAVLKVAPANFDSEPILCRAF